MEHLHLSSPPGDGADGDHHHHGHHDDGKDHDPHHHGDYLSSQSLACVSFYFILFTIQLSLMVQMNLVIMKHDDDDDDSDDNVIRIWPF